MPASVRAERQALLQLGETRLRQGDAEGAAAAFERVMGMLHDPEAELGLLRTQMQTGHYAQALAFAAHTAGVHLDETAGAAFYAWLLNLGAQTAVAEQVLQQAEAQSPSDPILKATRRALNAGTSLTDDELLQGPARMAPFAVGRQPTAEAAVRGSACLLPDGRHALVPWSVWQQVREARVIWLRNGRGQGVQAHVVQHDEALGVAVLALDEPLPTAQGAALAPHDAFPGSPAYALDYAADPKGRPAWPVMRAGFLGMPLASDASGRARKLGVALPGHGPRGGPVYDASGRLIGLAVGIDAGPAQMDHLLPIHALRQWMGESSASWFGDVSADVKQPNLGADDVYERGLRSALQVLVSSP